ncbi:hypothetical protein CBG58_08415 [Fusobacterium polymorphum]|uniref:hypothetical protein n=1 Tax=Fusobacterium nucleatum subsp. polymorphum TaxID=76857 RepID=UPI000BFD131D|nr:hypothetical protein [Fusobacterium polymorphum]PHI14926.1 hypothetical protein CBG58_08415 [Fusobacterium polymorphum]
MKKFLKTILFLCALSSLAYADEAAPVVAEGTASSMSAEDQKDAMDILERMRAKIEKEEEEKAKLAAEARELGVSPSEVASMDNVEELLEAKRAEEAKPKTEAEKLELTRKKALNKLDFYERVVRSVAREEAEVAGYYEIMGEEKARPSIMDEQKAEVTEQASPAEVPQEAAPVEANAQEKAVEQTK